MPLMKIYKIILSIISLVMVNNSFAQKDLLKTLLESKPEQFAKILAGQDKYEVQIIYTQIDRNKNNKPRFKTYNYAVDASHYFYPASTVKLPACVLALEKINNLNVAGLNKETSMITGASGYKQTAVKNDSSTKNFLPSVSNYAKKILMVSDNDAFNRLFEFVGQKDFNENLWKKGYKNLRIVHRLQSGNTPEENAHTNSIYFYKGQDIVYKQDSAYNPKSFFPTVPIKKGIGYIGADDKLVNEPLDFTKKNYFSLADQHNILKAILFPEAVKAKSRFNLTADDYTFLYKYMSQVPTQSLEPVYDKKAFYPTYCKFLLYGSEPQAALLPNIKIFNKVGDAYGFLIDNAYIVDFDKGVEFMVSVVIHCNEDQIYNDDKYDYDTIGYPFMKNLGQLIYDYEVNRVKKNKPDLSKFIVKYDD